MYPSTARTSLSLTSSVTALLQDAPSYTSAVPSAVTYSGTWSGTTGSGSGSEVGSGVGSSVGSGVGSGVGSSVGSGVGSGVGSSVSSGVGSSVGSGVGSSVGSGVSSGTYGSGVAKPNWASTMSASSAVAGAAIQSPSITVQASSGFSGLATCMGISETSSVCPSMASGCCQTISPFSLTSWSTPPVRAARCSSVSTVWSTQYTTSPSEVVTICTGSAWVDPSASQICTCAPVTPSIAAANGAQSMSSAHSSTAARARVIFFMESPPFIQSILL